MWAQAYSLYKRGEFLELPLDLKSKIQENNKRYMLGSVLTESISDLIEPSDAKYGRFMQTKDILSFIYSHTTQKNISDRAIAESLNNLKFQKVPKYIPERKYTVYGYYVKFRLLDEK
jgi:hypothetical protein